MRVIIAYKAIRGSVLIVAGLALAIALWLGEGAELHTLALSLREYVTARLAIDIAELILGLSTPSHLALTSLAVGLDGSVGIFEAWLLHRGQRWAIWLVVVASSLLIPWELYELFAHFRLLRVVLLILNVLVVIYLSFQARKHHAAYRLPFPQRVGDVGQGGEKIAESK